MGDLIYIHTALFNDGYLCLWFLFLPNVKLNGYGEAGVTYDERNGLPIRIPIRYISDFDVASNQDQAEVDQIYFAVGDIQGNGGTSFYDSSLTTLTLIEPQEVLTTANTSSTEEEGEFEIGLVLDADVDIDEGLSAGTYQVAIRIEMHYKNTAGDILMHFETYRITITSDGTGQVSHTLQQGSTTVSSTTSTTSAFVIKDSERPPDLRMVTSHQNQNAVKFGSPIEFAVATSLTKYKVWLDPSTPVKVFDSVSMHPIYGWPSTAVDAIVTETVATNKLKIALRDVPASFYEIPQSEIWIRLTVKFRGMEGGGGADEMNSIGSEEFTSKIQLNMKSLSKSQQGTDEEFLLKVVLPIVVGGVALIAVVVVFIYCYVQKNRQLNENGPASAKDSCLTNKKRKDGNSGRITTATNTSSKGKNDPLSLQDDTEYGDHTTNMEMSATCFDYDHSTSGGGGDYQAVLLNSPTFKKPKVNLTHGFQSPTGTMTRTPTSQKPKLQSMPVCLKSPGGTIYEV